MITTRIILFLLLAVWHLSATAFFGWNVLPQSAEEYIVDGIYIIGFAVIWCR